MARPVGSVAAIRKIRRDYRFAPETMQQISDGRAAFAGTLNETDFVERAIAHYAEFLAGDPVSLTPMNEEMERLQKQIHDLEGDLRDTQEALRQAEAALTSRHKTAQGKTKKPQIRKKPTISIDHLKPGGTMRSFLLKWKQDGLIAVASLDPIDERSSAQGYQLDCYCSSVARSGQPLGVRQPEQSKELIKLARARMIEALQKAGWKPDDLTNPAVTVWKYHDDE